ncbi:hypothetical protein PR048_008396 [Dryococelus australis]|uniref:Uncharacterized protein n=1 Tax=Dryococelus australis TaxID=614101 RepID=A0ABQ9HX03_9NEOP|nr:hypothetical protein PR048_008396 [Dryococelus australis]
MKDVTRIVNLIRGGNRAQSHRKLLEFLKERSAEYQDIPLHSEIRWLSAEWLCTLDFLTDITEDLNILNLKLQCKKQNICQLMTHIMLSGKN